MEAQFLGAFISIYVRFAIAEGKSDRTIEHVTSAVRHFHRFLGGCQDITQVAAEDLREYVRHLQRRPRWDGHPTIGAGHGALSPHAIASYVRGIRSFWAWLAREGFIDTSPFLTVKPPKAPRTIAVILSEAEVAAFLNVIPRDDPTGYRDLSMLLTLYGTGLRVQELTALRLDDVSFESGQITVMGKGSKERRVFMSARVFKVLLKYREKYRPKAHSSYFFLTRNGRPLTRFQVAHHMSEYCLKAGVTGSRCSPKTLRSTFAVHFLRNGGDVFTLQKILGHSTLDMTRRYAELADSDVEVKMKTCSPAETLKIKL